MAKFHSQNDYVPFIEQVLAKQTGPVDFNFLYRRVKRRVERIGFLNDEDKVLNPSTEKPRYVQILENLHSNRSPRLAQYRRKDDLYYPTAKLRTKVQERKERFAKATPYPENLDDVVTEGKASREEVLVRKRSTKVRAAALKRNLARHGVYRCVACGCGDDTVVARLGKTAMDVHHINKICECDPWGEDATLGLHLDNVAVVCGTCHRGMHKTKLLNPLDYSKVLTEMDRLPA